MAALALDSIAQHLMKTRTRAAREFQREHGSYFPQAPRHPRRQSGHRRKGRVSLELLGRETATQLFKRLGIEAQETLLKFLHAGVYERSKMELMLEAGEELKTRMLAESFDQVRTGASEKIGERLLQLSDDDLMIGRPRSRPECSTQAFPLSRSDENRASARQPEAHGFQEVRRDGDRHLENARCRPARAI